MANSCPSLHGPITNITLLHSAIDVSQKSAESSCKLHMADRSLISRNPLNPKPYTWYAHVHAYVKDVYVRLSIHTYIHTYIHTHRCTPYIPLFIFSLSLSLSPSSSSSLFLPGLYTPSETHSLSLPPSLPP